MQVCIQYQEELTVSSFFKKNLWFIVFWDASNNALFMSYV